MTCCYNQAIIFTRMWLLKKKYRYFSIWLYISLSNISHLHYVNFYVSFLLSVLCTLSTWKSSGVLQLEIVCVDSTKAWARTPIVWPIWIRTCRTIWSTRWPSSPYPRNGCGVRLGAAQKNWLGQRLLIS